MEDNKGGKRDVVLSDNRIVMPVFAVRRMTSSVELENGGWVFLGGLPEGGKGALAKEIEQDPQMPAIEGDAEPEGPVFLLIHASLVERAGER